MYLSAALTWILAAAGTGAAWLAAAHAHARSVPGMPACRRCSYVHMVSQMHAVHCHHLQLDLQATPVLSLILACGNGWRRCAL